MSAIQQLSTNMAKPIIDQALSSIESIIIGKTEQVKLAVCCLLSSSHCLIEDLPGVGKTTLAHALAGVFGLQFNRIQFTSDLLPADILGVSIFNPNEQRFDFHPGPIFAHCILADELNRATPKTQSALLEAMEERQITLDGETRTLKQPFFVIGTQNPLDQSGTFPLPESQLDRFMMKLNLGYPDQAAERALLKGESRQELLQTLKPVTDLQTVLELQQKVSDIHASDPLIEYLQSLVAQTRDPQKFLYGLSPRAALAILRAARSWAMMQGRDYVEPADIKLVFPAVSSHRLVAAEQHQQGIESMVNTLLDQTPIP